MIGLRMLGRSERGLTLVETIAAILVFAVVTIGIVPLLASSMQGTALARSYTVGKEVARQATERVRGLPFYISFDTLSQKVDVLDMYLPCADESMNASACDGAGERTYYPSSHEDQNLAGAFEIACSPDTGDPACAVEIPAGYTVTFRTKFVQEDGVTTEFAPSDYAWNVVGKDGPATDLVHMTVRADWMMNGRERSFEMHTLVGDRKAGNVKVSGSGRVHYGAQVLTRYRKPADGSTPEEISDLTAVIGSSESRIESRLVSTADQNFRTADIELIAQTEPEPTDLAELTGAVGAWRAPPAFAATTSLPSTDNQEVMEHPSILGQDVAYLHDTSIDSVEVRVDEEQPVAGGTFSLPNASGNLGYVRVQPQRPEDALDLLTNPLRLDYTRWMFSLARVESDDPPMPADGHPQMEASTEAVTGDLTTDRRVQTNASLFIRETRLFPVDYIGTGASFRRSVLQIQNFEAAVDCNATGTSATSEAEWSATIRYWTHAEGFQTVTVTGADHGGSDLKAVLGGNVLLHSPATGPDLYLFDEPEEDRKGYVTSFKLAAPAASTEGGTLAGAGITDAISITTVPPNPDFAESALVVSIGKLNCTAMDDR